MDGRCTRGVDVLRQFVKRLALPPGHTTLTGPRAVRAEHEEAGAARLRDQLLLNGTAHVAEAAHGAREHAKLLVLLVDNCGLQLALFLQLLLVPLVHLCRTLTLLAADRGGLSVPRRGLWPAAHIALL